MNRYLSYIFCLILAISWQPVLSQSCQQNLEDATRSYLNGQLREVNTKLEGCYATLDKEDRFDALKLMVNTNLLLNQDEKADQYMQELLILRPDYKIRDNDLAEFKGLYGTYKLRSKFTYGISGGVVLPDYVILYHHSYSGQAEQPDDYKEIPGFSIGINGSWEFVKNLYLDGALLYSKRGFEQKEILMGFRQVTSSEREFYLNVPLQVKYLIPVQNFRFYLGGGYGLHYMLRSKADIDHWPIDTEENSLNGTPKSVRSYDLTSQRTRFSHNWMVSGSLQYQISSFVLDISVSYQRGLTNQSSGEDRYSNITFLEDYAYVPDDYKVNTYLVSIGIFKSILRPHKSR